jgi:8-oxo-dGTP diphosphatase
MTAELWQVFDAQAQMVPGATTTRQEAFRNGVLHGAAHIWIWRKNQDQTQVLLQRRAPHKVNWPGCWDISAAGHIDAGETPLQCAIRETREELGIDRPAEAFRLFAVHPTRLVSPEGNIEHEWQFLYSLEVDDDTFTLQTDELAEVRWQTLDTFIVEAMWFSGDRSPGLPAEVYQNLANERQESSYVPHGMAYYITVAENIGPNKGPL